jgi:hypothetical protein
MIYLERSAICHAAFLIGIRVVKKSPGSEIFNLDFLPSFSLHTAIVFFYKTPSKKQNLQYSYRKLVLPDFSD